MNKYQRIEFISGNTNDMHIKVRLEQDIDMLELLSMNITAKEAYQNFNADYGILVGRVIANGGVGIPNAKISIFIPLTDKDAEDSEISSIYPYKTPRNKNTEGKRYNLLPRVSNIDPQTGIATPKQPFGSFPIKEEIVTNMSLMNMYKKYYKYTAVTNDAGDYMIFGAPIGTQTVHMSVDITDIGEYSMSPASMINNLGYSPNFFSQDRSYIKPSNDLSDLPNIETQEITVDIIPFWGDTENFEIGITRQDFRIRSVVAPSFVIFANVFTDGPDALWGDDNDSGTIGKLYRAASDTCYTWGLNKRIGNITEKIYYYPNTISDDAINNGWESADPYNNMIELQKDEYTVYKRKGDIVIVINCNRCKVITDEYGNKQEVSGDYPYGIFTQFRGFLTIEYNADELPMTRKVNIGHGIVLDQIRYRLKFPQHSCIGQSFRPDGFNENPNYANIWRNQNFTFCYNRFYTLSKFHSIVANNSSWDNNCQFPPTQSAFLNKDCVNNNVAATRDPNWAVGIIVTDDIYHEQCYPHNLNINNGEHEGFGLQWMNMSIYLQQLGRVSEGQDGSICSLSTNTLFSEQWGNVPEYNNYYTCSINNQCFVAKQSNTSQFPRSDINWTDIVEVPLQDIITMSKIETKGFCSTSNINPLIGTNYRNSFYIPSVTQGIDNCWKTATPEIGTTCGDANYFYKGIFDSDVIDFMVNCLNIL